MHLPTASGRNNVLSPLVCVCVSRAPPSLPPRSDGPTLPRLLLSRYYGESPDIVSAGHDRTLRSVCTIRDERSAELSQGALAKKARKLNVRPADLRLPPVIAMAAEPSRQKDWPNVVTCHARTRDVHTWSYEDKVMSKSVLALPEAKTSKILATVRGGEGRALPAQAQAQAQAANVTRRQPPARIRCRFHIASCFASS